MKPYDHSKSKYSEAIGIDYETDRRNALALFDKISRRLSADDVDRNSIRNGEMAREIIEELDLSNRELASACLRVLMNSTDKEDIMQVIAMNVIALLYLDRERAFPVALTAARIVHDIITADSYSEACESIEKIIAEGCGAEVLTTTITAVVNNAIAISASETADELKGVIIQ